MSQRVNEWVRWGRPERISREATSNPRLRAIKFRRNRRQRSSRSPTRSACRGVECGQWTNTSSTSGDFSLRGTSSKLQFVISLRTADQLLQQLPGTYFTDWISAPTHKHSVPALDGVCLPGPYRAPFRHTTSDYRKTGRQSTSTVAPGRTERTSLANGRVPGSFGRTRIGPIPKLSTHFPGSRKQRMSACRFFCTSCVWVSLALWHKDMCRVRSGAQQAPSGPWQSDSMTEMPI
jgi:hypothetical protein